MVEQSRLRVVHPAPIGWVAVSLAALLVTACASLETGKFGDGSASPAADASLAGDGQKSGGRLVELARANGTNPHDAKVAMAYSRALKKEGRSREALAVLETASKAPAPARAVMVEFGLLSLELGQTAEAGKLLASVNDSSVQDRKSRDWRVLSGLGIASASQGQHAQAQQFFQSALELSPNNPAVLNNLAVSYMLDKKIDKAEQLLRRASKDGKGSARVGQNLALAVSLKGPRDDGEAIKTVAAQTTRPDNLQVGAPPMGLTRSPAAGISGSAGR